MIIMSPNGQTFNVYSHKVSKLVLHSFFVGFKQKFLHDRTEVGSESSLNTIQTLFLVVQIRSEHLGYVPTLCSTSA